MMFYSPRFECFGLDTNSHNVVPAPCDAKVMSRTEGNGCLTGSTRSSLQMIPFNHRSCCGVVAVGGGMSLHQHLH